MVARDFESLETKPNTDLSPPRDWKSLATFECPPGTGVIAAPKNGHTRLLGGWSRAANGVPTEWPRAGGGPLASICRGAIRHGFAR